jgi:hypothetical protein
VDFELVEVSDVTCKAQDEPKAANNKERINKTNDAKDPEASSRIVETKGSSVDDVMENVNVEDEKDIEYPPRLQFVLLTIALMLTVFITAIDRSIVGKYS